MKFPNLKNEKLLAIDIETFDPDIQELGPGPRRNGYILGVGIAVKDSAWYFPLNHDKTLFDGNIEKDNFYKWLLDQKDKNFVGANITYDLDFLQYQDFIPAGKINDILLAEPLIDENQRFFSLDSCAKKYLGERKGLNELKEMAKLNKWKGDYRSHLYKMPVDIVGEYCKKDCRLTYDVFQKQLEEIKKQELEIVYNLECDLIPMMLYMKKKGVRVNCENLEALNIIYTSRINVKQKKLDDICGFPTNVNATVDIQRVFDHFGWSYGMSDKDNPIFDSKALRENGTEIALLIDELRHIKQIKNTFLGGLSKYIINGRIHTQFNQLRGDEYGTVTGRMSSNSPNMQNIPSREEETKKDCRCLFLPEEDHIWGRDDQSQIELRLLMHYARGPKSNDMRQAYIDNPRLDLHQFFADIAGVKRKQAKSITFGVIYGMGKAKMARELDLSIEGAKNVMSKYYKNLPFLKKTFYDALGVAEKRGFVKTILGRRRRFPDKRFCYRALNAIIQGSAADVMKKSMVDAWGEGVFKHLVPHITVHDELDYSIPIEDDSFRYVAKLKEISENTIKFKVPLVCDHEEGPNWGDCE